MATPRRACLNCGKSLTGSDARTKTCSNACRQQLKRKRERRHAAKAEEAGSVAALARDIHDEHGRRSPVRQVVMEELRPVVREAIDDNVIRAIGAFVALAPTAIQALTEDLICDDPQIRQRAYSLVVKYALDNQHVTPQRADRPTLQIEVALPRPVAQNDPVPQTAEPEPVDVEPLKRCVACHFARAESQFPAGGPMCSECLELRKRRVLGAVLSKDAVQQPATAALLQRTGVSGRPEVHQAGSGLQPENVRPAGVQPDGAPPHPWVAQSREAAR